MKSNDNINIPQDAIDTLASLLLPEIQKFYESEEGQRDFEKWKNEQMTEDNQ